MAAALDSDTSNDGKVLASAIDCHESANLRTASTVSFSDIYAEGDTSVDSVRATWDKLMESLTSPDDDITIDSCLYDKQHTESCSGEKDENFDLFRRMVSLGPHGNGPNVLLMSPSLSIDVTNEFVIKPPQVLFRY